MHKNQSPEEALPNANDGFERSEISLLDILRFLKQTYKIICTLSTLGLISAIIYLVATPQQYQATAQVAMAQIGLANNSINNLNPLGVNIEEPAPLISRLAIPTSFTAKETAACGFKGKPDDAASALSKAVKISLVKGAPNVVELKIFSGSPESAKDCAVAIIELIKTTQLQILTPYIEEAKLKLMDDEDRLKRAKDLLSKADKFGSAMGATYLSTRDEVRYLQDEITSLNNVVTINQNRGARLIAPIYASDVPIAPKKSLVLANGLFGGLFLGLLIALARQMVLKLKSASGGVL